MIRNLKALGLALVAVFAMSAMVASAAHATVEFTASNTAKSHAHEHANLTGGQLTTHVFTATGGFASITCTTAHFTGTSATGTGTSQTITPHYTGCSDSLGRVADVNMKSCDYVFNPGATDVSKADTFKGTADITCTTAGDVIEVTVTRAAGHCTVTIPPQVGTGPIYYRNPTGATPTGIEVIAAATNITTETHGGFLACGTSTTHHTNGTYEGSTTVTCKNETAVPAENLDCSVVD